MPMEALPDLDTLSLADIARLVEEKKLPPVAQWNPDHCGHSDMRIARDGRWFYMGTPITRLPLVKLFATILRRDPERYVLVTPVERVGIVVEDAPFLAVEMADVEGGALAFRTNLDEVIVAGGVVRARDRGIVGEATIDLIRQFRVDFGVIGISGIDLDGTLLDFDYQEVRVAQAIIANSRQVFLAADHTKFGRNALVRLGAVEDVDALFTDAQPPAALRELIDAAGVALHVAGTAA